jgi:pimeloyl-ACP methyl ester carboxylesterase
MVCRRGTERGACTGNPFLDATLLVLATLVGLIHRAEMRAARARLRDRSHIVPSPYGDIEYAEGGCGTDVLIVHGAAGGWDQGALIAETVLDESRAHWIAPSRFGYLRSGCPAGVSVDDQAHAYALLLDHLGIGNVAVVAMSAGGPPALLFSVLHPQRVSSLTLLSCGVAPSTSDEQARAHRKGAILARLFRSDLAFWLPTRLFRKSLLRLMGVDAADVLTHSFDTLQWLDRMLAAMHPASLPHTSRSTAISRAARGATVRSRAPVPPPRRRTPRRA